MSWIETNETLLVPLLSLNVALVPAVLELSVMRLPAVPEAPKALTVCIVPAVSVMVAGCTLFVMLAKLLLCWIVSAPAPPWFSVGYVFPPPVNVLALALVMLMTPVPGTTARDAMLPLHDAPVMVHVLLPN